METVNRLKQELFMSLKCVQYLQMEQKQTGLMFMKLI